MLILRLTVVVLLACNFLLIAVRMASEPPPPAPIERVESFPADVPRLLLLSEVTPAVEEETEPEPAREFIADVDVGEVSEAAPEAILNTAPAEAPETAPAAAAPEDALADAVADATPEAPPEIPAAEPATPRCYTAGPFETVPTMIEAREAIGPLALYIRERDTDALVELGYWVSLPPTASFTEAGQQVQALNQAGLEDVAVVTDRSGEYRVSLGYFLEEMNARKRREEVRALGFDADTQVQRETQMRFWLDYAFEDAASAERVAETLPAGQQRAVPCPAPEGA